MSNSLHDDPDWLREQYWGKELSTSEVAKKADVSGSTIKRRLKKFGLGVRSRQEAAATNSDERLRSEEWLRDKYHGERLMQREIAEIVGTNSSVVSMWLSRHGIESRSKEESKALRRPDRLQNEEWLYDQYHSEDKTTYEIADELGVDQHTVLNWMDRFGIDRVMPDRNDDPRTPDELRDPEWLREKHHEQSLPITRIAHELECDRGTVSRWMGRHGIATKPPGRTVSGELAATPPTVRGQFWLRQREKALERDSNQCRACGMPASEHMDLRGRGLEVHHIRPAKHFETRQEAHKLENLVTLCFQCHNRLEGLPLDVRGMEERA